MRMRTIKVVLMVLALCSVATSRAQSTGSVPATGSYLLPVEHGDSLLELFGPSWQSVYERNKSLFRAGNAAVPSPNCLIAGTLLEVPSTVLLTPKAQARMSKIQEQRNAIHSRLARLEGAGGEIGTEAAALDARLNTMRFVADLEFVSGATETLEQVKAQPQPERKTYATKAGGVGIGVVLLLLAFLLFRRTPARQSGDAGMMAALSLFEKNA